MANAEVTVISYCTSDIGQAVVNFSNRFDTKLLRQLAVLHLANCAGSVPLQARFAIDRARLSNYIATAHKTPFYFDLKPD